MLCHLLFAVTINDLPTFLNSEAVFFADDVCFRETDTDIKILNKLAQSSLNKIVSVIKSAALLFPKKRKNKQVSRVESSRTSLASRTHFEVLGLGLEASSPRKLRCPRLEDCTIFWIVKILQIAWKKIFENLFFKSPEKTFEDLCFFKEHLRLCPWFLALASRGSVLGMAVLGLGLGFFCVLGLGLEPCVLDSKFLWS